MALGATNVVPTAPEFCFYALELGALEQAAFAQAGFDRVQHTVLKVFYG